MEFRRDRNSVSNLQAHLVFVTKYRRKVLTQESLSLLEESLKAAVLGVSRAGGIRRGFRPSFFDKLLVP